MFNILWKASRKDLTMHAYDALKKAAKTAGVPLTHIGPAMGKPAPYVNTGISRGSTPKADTLAAMLDVCGYSLAAIPHADVPPDALVIDPPEQ